MRVKFDSNSTLGAQSLAPSSMYVRPDWLQNNVDVPIHEHHCKVACAGYVLRQMLTIRPRVNSSDLLPPPEPYNYPMKFLEECGAKYLSILEYTSHLIHFKPHSYRHLLQFPVSLLLPRSFQHLPHLRFLDLFQVFHGWLPFLQLPQAKVSPCVLTTDDRSRIVLD